MKKTTVIFALALSALLLASAGCGEKATTTTREDSAAKTTPAAGGQQAVATNANLWIGEVVETMDSGGYTYVHVDTGSEKIWAASPVTKVEVGQKVSVPKGMMMKNFASKTLDRTFDEIYFVEGIYPAGGMPATEHPRADHPTAEHPGSEHPQAEHPGSTAGSHTNTKVEDAAVEGVVKLADGQTVAEIFAQSNTLSGQTVKVRGKVVKFTANIMGTNWVHIQDGSKGDLTVTTDAVVAIGDLVVVEGPLTVNKDFGAGYKYDAIIEKATVTKE